MRSIEIVTRSPEETQRFGRRMGELCRGGECLLLDGALGSGKTCFVQGLARGLGVPEEEPVASPTFVLHARYEGRLVLEHIDAYRLGEAADADSLGFEECWNPGSVAAVEWPQRLSSALPSRFLSLSFETVSALSRRIRLASSSPPHESYPLFLKEVTDALKEEGLSFSIPS